MAISPKLKTLIAKCKKQKELMFKAQSDYHSTRVQVIEAMDDGKKLTNNEYFKILKDL